MKLTNPFFHLALLAALWAPACTIQTDPDGDDTESVDEDDDDRSETNSTDATTGDAGDTTETTGPARPETDTESTSGDTSEEPTTSSDGGLEAGSDETDSGTSEESPDASTDDATDESSTTDDESTDDVTEESSTTDDVTDDEPATTDDDVTDDDVTDDNTTDDEGNPSGDPAIEDDARGVSGPLLLQVTTAQSPAIPGQRLLYSITVGNTSNVAVEAVNVLFRVPAGLQFNRTTHAEPDSSYCAGSASCTAGTEATWNLGTLAAGSTQTIFVNPEVLSSVGDGDTIGTFVRVNATNVNPVSVTKTVPVLSAPLAALTLSAPSDVVTPGQSIELELDLGQIGGTPLSDGELRLLLPGGLTPTLISDGGTESSDGQIAWPIGAVAVGTTLKRTLTATVSSNITPGQILNPRASFVHAGGLEQDNVAQLPLSMVASKPPLTLTIANGSSPVLPGGRALYRATVTNNALRAIAGVNLFLRVPRGLQFNRTAHAEPDSSYCAGSASCTSGTEAFWNLGSINAGEAVTIDIVPEVVGTVAGDGTLLAASFGLRGTDTNPINVHKTLPVQSSPAAQLALETLVDVATPGQTLTYELRVGQVGAQALSNTELVLQLPPGVSAGAISDSGAQSSSGEVVWNLGTVPVASTLRRSVNVTVDAGVTVASVLRARAFLSYDGGMEVDAASEHTLNIAAAQPPLSITFEATPDPITLGQRILYTTTITNTSARAIEGVQLSFRVPDGLTYNRTTHADPDSSYCAGSASCTAGLEGLWNLGTLAAGASQIITVNPLVATTLVGGSLVTARQRLTATGLGSTINLQKTVATTN